MNFLMDYNLTNEEIEKIKKNNSETNINNIIINKQNVRLVADYLRSLGITVETLRDLFMYQIGIFFRTKKELEQMFEEYEINSIVKSLNYDVNTYDLIEF